MLEALLPLKKKITYLLEKFPVAYNIAVKCHNFIYLIQYAFKGTKLEEKYWERRHLSKGDDWQNKESGDWIEGYWNTQKHPHRQFLIENIASVQGSSILEIGCNCGPNLRLLAERFPKSSMVGIEINAEAIQKGNELMAEEGRSNVKLICGKADDLSQFPDKSFDVIFTDAVLIYIGSDKIKKVLEEMFRVSRKTIFLLEWHDFNKEDNLLGQYKRHWIRHYGSLIKEYFPDAKTEIIKLPAKLWADKNWQNFGAIVKINL